jgi:uncharacterized protein YecT (DUF1311 family)
MFQRKITLFVSFLIFFPTLSLAQDLIDCKTTVATPELISCSGEEFKRSDKELNDIYSNFVSSAGNENSPAIKNAQVAWIRFKARHCQLVYDSEFPGTEAPIAKNYCLQITTRDRAAEMERIMQRKVDRCQRCDYFFRTMAVFSASGYKRSEVLSKINARVFNKSGNEWNNYVQATCDFSVKYIGDKRDMCEARLNFIYLRNYAQVTDDD